MLRSRQDLLLGEGLLLLGAGHNEDWLLASGRGLDVGVGLGSKGLDFAACKSSIDVIY